MNEIQYYGQPYAQEVLMMLKDMHLHTTKYQDCGVHIPRGILLVGEPGIGKTLFAYKAAEVLEKELIVIKPYSDLLSSEIERCFSLARERKNCIVLVDEIFNMIYRDEKTEGQLLAELDSFNDFLVIATTSAHDYEMAQYEALTRPGRFDFKIYMSWPSYRDRLTFFQDKLQLMKIDYDASILAEITSEQSYAFMHTLLNHIKMSSTYLNTPIDHDLVYSLKEKLSNFSSHQEDTNLDILYQIAVHKLGHAIYGLLSGRSVALIELSKKGYKAKTTFHASKCQTINDYITEIEISLSGYAAGVVVLKQHYKGAELDFEDTRNLFSMIFRSSLHLDNITATTFVQNGPQEQLTNTYKKLYLTTIRKAFRKAKITLKKHRQIIRNYAVILVQKSILTNDDIELLFEE
ncbi:MAG: AAA family ATPase, partial [bacterium]|nr:AAA family ATPase [bacterium]